MAWQDISKALDNAVANGCADQLARMTVEDIAYEMSDNPEWRCEGCGHGPHGPVCLANSPLVCHCDGQPEHDVVCQHGTAVDVHCCRCHSGFLFDTAICVCLGRACGAPTPDRSGRSCDKPQGHEGPHWTYGSNTLTWDRR